jgi:hypothetical protein
LIPWEISGFQYFARRKFFPERLPGCRSPAGMRVAVAMLLVVLRNLCFQYFARRKFFPARAEDITSRAAVCVPSARHWSCRSVIVLPLVRGAATLP